MLPSTLSFLASVDLKGTVLIVRCPLKRRAGVALTLTAVGAGTIGAVSVAPGDVATPTGTALVFNPGDSISNTALVALHADGTLRVLADHAVNLIIDVQGYFTAGSADRAGRFRGRGPGPHR